jgi:hypothetical protein
MRVHDRGSGSLSDAPAAAAKSGEPSSGKLESRACRRRTRLNQAVLDLPAELFSDEAIKGLADDWIVPMIVEQLLGCAGRLAS